MSDDVEARRAEIDAIDEQLLQLLNERARLAIEVGLLKKRQHMPLCDPDRERQVLQRLCNSIDGPLDERAVNKIFKTIIDESRRIQSVESVAESPKWNRVTIVGCGLIGSSFALALRKNGMCQRVVGWDASQDILSEARNRGIVDEIDSSFTHGRVSTSDLIYLAMPIGDIISFLRERGAQVKAGALITDSGSTKAEICRAAREYLPPDRFFVGGHPIAGSHHSGLAYADSALFTDAPYVLVNGGAAIDKLRDIEQTLHAMGAHVTLMTAEAHDRALAFISHLPQLLSITLAATLGNETDRDSLLALSGNGLRDMTRLAGSSWSMWRDILATNHEQIAEALAAIMQRLEIVSDEVQTESMERASAFVATGKLFADANHLLAKTNDV